MTNQPTNPELAATVVELSATDDLVHQLTMQAMALEAVDADGSLYAAIVPPGWTFETLDLSRFGGFPPRSKVGGPVLVDVASFVDYCTAQDEHAYQAAAYYFDPATAIVTAVFDDHTGASPGAARHRAVLQVETSPAFAVLLAGDGAMVRSRVFAEWIEDHRELIAEPSTAELLELVRTFKATKFHTVEDTHNPTSGDVTLHYETETKLQGDMTVPQTFTFAAPVYRGQGPRVIEARFRYSLDDGRPTFGYRLIALDAVIESAQDHLLAELDVALGGVTIRRGTPPAPR